jgi:SWI/SNF-related matrix-associated actin-dependent regulator of chromatin subfamily A3
MAELDKKLSKGGTSPVQGHLQLELVLSGSHFQIFFPDGVVLGEVNTQLDNALLHISEQRYELGYEVFAPIKAMRETISKVIREKEAIVRVQVNVYGPLSAAEDVGREFSKAKLYLQSPDYVRYGTTYDNPHVLKLANSQAKELTAVQYVEEQGTGKAAAGELNQAIKDVYSSLTRSQNLEGLEGDERLLTPLLLYVFSQDMCEIILLMFLVIRKKH